SRSTVSSATPTATAASAWPTSARSPPATSPPCPEAAAAAVEPPAPAHCPAKNTPWSRERLDGRTPLIPSHGDRPLGVLQVPDAALAVEIIMNRGRPQDKQDTPPYGQAGLAVDGVHGRDRRAARRAPTRRPSCRSADSGSTAAARSPRLPASRTAASTSPAEG